MVSDFTFKKTKDNILTAKELEDELARQVDNKEMDSIINS